MQEEKREEPKKRFLPPGCWGPIVIFWGAVLAFGGGAFGVVATFLTANDGKGLENIGRSNPDVNMWDNLAAGGIILMVLGVGLMFVQGLLWLVHKVMARNEESES